MEREGVSGMHGWGSEARGSGGNRSVRAFAKGLLGVLVLIGLTAGGLAFRRPEAGASMAGSAVLYSVQLHVHGSISEGFGRMVDHAARAREIGVDLLWWSDHEGKYTPLLAEEEEGLTFDFEFGELWIPPGPRLPGRGFEVRDSVEFVSISLVDTSAAGGNQCMALVADDGASADSARFAGADYVIDHNNAIRSLLQEVRLDFQARLASPPTPGRNFALRCGFSRNLEGHQWTLMYLDTDGPLPPDEPHVHYLRLPPLSEAGWTHIQINVAEDGRTAFERGEDLAFHRASLGWWLESDGYSAVLLDDVALGIDGPFGEDLILAQQDYLATLDEPSPAHFVGVEAAGGRNKTEVHHVNLFAPSGLPSLPDYEDPRFNPVDYPENLIQWAHAQGYTVSYNHLFGARWGKWMSPEEGERRKTRTVVNRAYGADLFEVGYPDRGRPLREYFETWDALLRNNSFQTGIGTSDNHHTDPWDEVENRFVTWVRLSAPSRWSVLRELEAGRACLGDPVLAGEDAYLALSGAGRAFAMGDVVLTEATTLPLLCLGASEPANLILRLITVTEEERDTLTQVVSGPAPFRVQFDAQISGPTHVRAELHLQETGALLLASNPIHFRREAPESTAPGLEGREIVDLREPH